MLAFLVTFGALALIGSVVRVIAVYQHFYALGMQTDDPAVATLAARELARIDGSYTPVFLLVAMILSVVAAGVFARRRVETR